MNNRMNTHICIGYFRFYVFCLKNIFVSYSILKTKEKQKVYYNLYGRDFYYLLILLRAISIISLTFIALYNGNIFVYPNAYLNLLFNYLALYAICLFLILAIYSFQNNKIRFFYIRDEDILPNDWMFKKTIFQQYAPFYSPVITRIWSSETNNLYEFNYRYSRLSKFLFRLIDIIICFYILIVGVFSTFKSLILPNCEICNLALLLIIHQMFVFILAIINAQQYKKATFIIIDRDY